MHAKCFALIAVFVCGSANAQVTVIRAARLLDTESGRVVSPAVVVVEGDRIRDVNPAQVPQAAETIELGDATLLPGLIDMHTHLGDAPGADWIAVRAHETPAMWALRAAGNARLALMNGFTTVREAGSSGFVDVALMRATDEGWVDGPRVVPVGHYITITGGHCDLTGFAPGVLERGPESGVADGVDEVRKAVRYQIKHGAKWIKVCATAGILSFEGPSGAQQYAEEEIRAAVEEAARHGIRVLAHAHGTEGILAAIRAGVASIEHGSRLTPEAISLMKERGIWLVPQAYWDAYDPATLPPPIRKKYEEMRPFAEQSLKDAIQASVRIAFSTDGPLPKNDPWSEFVALVAAGMTPTQALQSATVRAAELLGADDRGRIAAGLYADLIAVAGDPTLGLTAQPDIRFIMKGGRIYRGPSP
jgi:imidazolonepropionase-like amidohydrolase